MDDDTGTHHWTLTTDGTEAVTTAYQPISGMNAGGWVADEVTSGYLRVGDNVPEDIEHGMNIQGDLRVQGGLHVEGDLEIDGNIILHGGRILRPAEEESLIEEFPVSGTVHHIENEDQLQNVFGIPSGETHQLAHAILDSGSDIRVERVFNDQEDQDGG